MPVVTRLMKRKRRSRIFDEIYGVHRFRITKFLTRQDVKSLWVCSTAVHKLLLRYIMDVQYIIPNRTWGNEVFTWSADCVRLECVRKMHLDEEFDDRLSPDMLPTRLTFLRFGNEFNQPLDKGVLPDGLPVLRFGHMFNQPLEKGVLPNGLTNLTFGHSFNHTLKNGVFPEGLQHIRFGLGFDQPFETFRQPGYIPASVVTVTFARNYDLPRGHLQKCPFFCRRGTLLG